jgi:mannose/fructose/sorbose-specific phosphotransferase system IIA component
MSEPRRRIGCVLVAHGRVAECLIEAVQGILGKQSGWATVSNVGLGLKELSEAVTRTVDDLSKSHDVVILSDMPGGSCHHACRELAALRPGTRVVSGLNLMMLLEFFVKRERNAIDDLVVLIEERGRDSVRAS